MLLWADSSELSLQAYAKKIKAQISFLASHVFNPYKPIVIFVGQMQTVQTQTRRRRPRRLIRVSTVCLLNVLLKFE